MGRGLLPNMLNMGWGVCVCIALSFPRYEVSFFLSPKSRGLGERGKRLQRARLWGKEDGGAQQPVRREDTGLPGGGWTLA